MTPLIYSLPLIVLSFLIQVETRKITSLMADNRLLVMASRDRCPELYNTPTCKFSVMARRAGRWANCDWSAPPSGADMPMHRWFLISGKCRISLVGMAVGFDLPTHKILR